MKVTIAIVTRQVVAYSVSKIVLMVYDSLREMAIGTYKLSAWSQKLKYTFDSLMP